MVCFGYNGKPNTEVYSGGSNYPYSTAKRLKVVDRLHSLQTGALGYWLGCLATTFLSHKILI